LGVKKTVILITQYPSEVEATCDRIFIINKGRLVADGTPENLRKQAQGSDIVKVRIEDGDPDQIFKSLREIKTVSMVDFSDRHMNRFEVHCRAESAKREIFNLCVSKKWVLTEMTPHETKLEDIFRELTMN
jgi:ABC-2 type transport system ATP-binding protein